MKPTARAEYLEVNVMVCLFGHKWDGCKCTKCGKTRDEGHDWDLCKGVCKRCGATQPAKHDWDLCKGVCKRCGAEQPEQHDWDGLKCKRCGKTRKFASPVNLVVVAMKLIEGEMAENDPAVANKAFSLANYAVKNEFMLSPAFADLYRKYASLTGLDQWIFGTSVDPIHDVTEWIASQTDESQEQINILEWTRLFRMNGTDSIGSGNARVRFCVASYFYIP